MPSRPNGHLAGKKYAAGHTSVIGPAVAPAQAAAALACVSKVSLGLIKPIGNGPRSLKFLELSPGCILVRIRGSRSIQEIRVYTNDTETTEAAMREAFLAV